jgi:limonene-1,2-epoxide hydrolase
MYRILLGTEADREMDDPRCGAESSDVPICSVFEIEEGRIKAWREYFDMAPVNAAYNEA